MKFLLLLCCLSYGGNMSIFYTDKETIMRSQDFIDQETQGESYCLIVKLQAGQNYSRSDIYRPLGTLFNPCNRQIINVMLSTNKGLLMTMQCSPNISFAELCDSIPDIKQILSVIKHNYSQILYLCNSALYDNNITPLLMYCLNLPDLPDDLKKFIHNRLCYYNNVYKFSINLNNASLRIGKGQLKVDWSDLLTSYHYDQNLINNYLARHYLVAGFSTVACNLYTSDMNVFAKNWLLEIYSKHNTTQSNIQKSGDIDKLNLDPNIGKALNLDPPILGS